MVGALSPSVSRIVLVLLCVSAGLIAGCGDESPPAPTAAQIERDAAVSERDTQSVYLVATAAYACRDADLGEPIKYRSRIKKRMAELIRIGELHPDDDYGSDSEGRTPAERLHRAAELLSCDPRLAKQVEIAARDSEVLQTR